MEESKLAATPMNQKGNFYKEDGAENVHEKLYRSLISCIMYSIATRPGILHVVNLLSKYTSCASKIHFRAAKRVLIYVKGKLILIYDENFSLLGYSDCD